LEIFGENKLYDHIEKVSHLLNRDKTIITAEIDMTNSCNQKCPKCTGFKEEQVSISYEEAVDYIDQLNEMDVKGIVFTGGGEPLCNVSTVDVIEYAKHRGLDVGIITNGLDMYGPTYDSLIINCTWVRISLDAGTPEMYKITHGMEKNHFEKVIENIKGLVEHKGSNKSPTIGTAFLTGEETVKDMYNFAKLSKSLGVDYAQFRPFHWDKTDVSKELQKCKSLETDDFKIMASVQKYQFFKNKDVRPYDVCRGANFRTVIAADSKVYVCFDGDTKIIINNKGNIKCLPFREAVKIKSDCSILNNGEWVSIKTWVKKKINSYKDILTVELENGVRIRPALHHKFLTKEGLKFGYELTENDYLPFARKGYDSIYNHNYDRGRLCGLFLAEGCFIKHHKNMVQYSFHEDETGYINFVVNSIEDIFGVKETIIHNRGDHCKSIIFNDVGLKGYLKSFFNGNNSMNWRIRNKCYMQSKEFREGLLEGIREGDGDKRGYLHLGNKNLIEDLSFIFASLGYNYSKGKWSTGYRLNLIKQKRKINAHSEYFWIKIKRILQGTHNNKEYKNKYVYCVEVDTEDHLFQLANGLISYNCCHWRSNPNMCLGDLKKQSFKEIWQNRQEVIDNLDLRYCVPFCILDKVNRELHNMVKRREHKNFL